MRRNSAPWAVPATISCGVRMNFFTVRPATVKVDTSRVAPGEKAGPRGSMVVVVMTCTFRSGDAVVGVVAVGVAVVGVVAVGVAAVGVVVRGGRGRCAGELQEDLVERG